VEHGFVQEAPAAMALAFSLHKRASLCDGSRHG